MGELRVLNKSGDIKVEWDPKDAASVANAKVEWDRLKADGYEFFEVTEAKGKKIDRFKKSAGRVIAAPGIKKPAERTSGVRQRAMAGGPNSRLVGFG